MKKLSLSLVILCTSVFSTAWTDTVVWSGNVSAKGTPTPVIQLVLGKKYQVKVSGTLNLGKWWQAGKQLEEDAFFEYNNAVEPFKLETLKNSLNLPLSDTTFHADHVYISKPFIATQTGFHFWISDTDYKGNTGALQVQVIELEEAVDSKKTAALQVQNEISRGGGYRDESLENRGNEAEQRGNQNREQRLNNEQQNSEGRQQERNQISRGGEGRDESLENRDDNAEQNGNEYREERLNDELDNSERRQSERPDSNSYPAPQN